MAKDKSQLPAVDAVKDRIQDTSFQKALSERYLTYALSTIMSRSLPDVRDGLKPVHRRVLYAMHELGLGPQKAYKKSARVVGDVIGKYHPHGEGSIYDALVRLAQDFVSRYPLVDGQGNFGNIDGDSAAAMRYTEARLTSVAEALLEGIEEETVAFRPTYDGSMDEPVLLPARFPNLLANGAMGIAVGMASSIPPHHVGELCAALLHLIDAPDATVKDLMTHVKGPDFPTGGILLETPESLVNSYETGRGSFRLRARWHKEEIKGGGYQIVITEIPYHVQKSKLLEKTADLMEAKKLPFLGDFQDESTTDIRLVLIPKTRNIEPEHLMENLFRETDLESRVSLNMNVLDANGMPRVMSLKEVLSAFLTYRQKVILDQARFRLQKIQERLAVLEALLVVFLNLDQVIQIIREDDDPKESLIKTFSLSEEQAESILNTRLRSLRKLEEMEIKRERDHLTQKAQDLIDLLESEKIQKKTLKEDIRWMQTKFGDSSPFGSRRTQIELPSTHAITFEIPVEEEPLTIVCSEKGWIRAIGGHLAPDELEKIKYKEGDQTRFALHSQTTDRILVGSLNGKFYTLLADKIPRGRGFGEPLKMLSEWAQGDDLLTIFSLKRKDETQKVILIAEDGRGFVAKAEDLVAQTRVGKQILNLPDGVRARAYISVPEGADMLALLGTNKRLLLLTIADIPHLSRGRGVILQKYKGSSLEDFCTFSMQEGLLWTDGKKRQRLEKPEFWHWKCADMGRLAPHGFRFAQR